MTRLIVTVDGIDGSGKSTFADRLAAGLTAEGLVPCIVRIDDFRRPVDWGAGDEVSLYYDRYFDLAAVSGIAAAFAAGSPSLTVPTFDGLAGVAGHTRTVAAGPAAALLVEGVFIRRVPWPEPAWHIYLDVPFEIGQARVMARDVARGRTPSEVDRRWRLRYRPAQERYLRECRPVQEASVVLENSLPDAPRHLRGDLAALPAPLARALSAFGEV
jgi:uridine kinase